MERIEVLSAVNSCMAGDRVPGVEEPAGLRPLAIALSLVAG
jgi:hypothetical protein